MPMRNLLYLHLNTAEKHIICHGVDFKGFLTSLEKPINNILLIKHGYDGKNYNSQSGFTYVSGGEIEKLKAENISKYGDFCWLDFEDEFILDQLTRLDIAELLYFGHKRRPFSSFVFTRLQNRFAYWSHDDGWFSSIYFADSTEMQTFISCAVSSIARTKHLTAGKFPPETAKEMVGLSENGLLIDNGDLFEEDDMVVLPFYVVGKVTNMDDLLNNTSLYKKNAQKRGALRFKKKDDKYLTWFWRRQNKKSNKDTP